MHASMPVIPTLREWRQEDKEFKIILSYIESSRTACPMWNHVKEKKRGGREENGNTLFPLAITRNT